jgi:hypothetical protein
VKKRILGFLLIAIISCGCARVRHPVPEDLVTRAQVPGMPDVRAFGAQPSGMLINDFLELLRLEGADGFSFFDLKEEKTYAALAVSGGAANGAYGAGLLCGWSKAGTRPDFKVVTGISTGAIIATYAFLGSKYDGELKEFYTSYSTKDVWRNKGIFQILFGNSFTNNFPLQKLLANHFDQNLLKDVAHEYKKGRRLYVGTTDLDSQRLVIWDMGKIANIGSYEALKLFRNILLASATIPAALPPVYFNVEVDNKVYDEMHVDGGTIRQVFFLYDVLRGFSKAAEEKNLDVSKIKYDIYVIRNGYTDPVWKPVPDRISSIAERAIDTTTNAQTIGDLYQLYALSKIGKGDFNLAYIPATHKSKAKEFFDPVEMRALFDLGFEEASHGYQWKKTPPGLEAAPPSRE